MAEYTWFAVTKCAKAHCRRIFRVCSRESRQLGVRIGASGSQPQWHRPLTSIVRSSVLDSTRRRSCAPARTSLSLAILDWTNMANRLAAHRRRKYGFLWFRFAELLESDWNWLPYWLNFCSPSTTSFCGAHRSNSSEVRECQSGCGGLAAVAVRRRSSNLVAHSGRMVVNSCPFAASRAQPTRASNGTLFIRSDTLTAVTSPPELFWWGIEAPDCTQES